MAKKRTITLHLPEDLDDREHAELANVVWMIGATSRMWGKAPSAGAVEVDAPDPDAVYAEMDKLWKAAPEWIRTEAGCTRSGSPTSRQEFGCFCPA
jgi:hypothetical protein